MASYPSSAKTFTTKAAGDTIQPAHVNDLQDEITALETALLTGGLAHALFPSSTTQTLGSATKPWGDTYLAATKKLYLDSGGNTYLHEQAADTVGIVVGGSNAAIVTATVFSLNGDLVTPATGKVRLDGSSTGNTYITEASADSIWIVAGGNLVVGIGSNYAYLPATYKFYLDGGSDTYIHEEGANLLSAVAGGVRGWRIDGSGNLDIQATKNFYLDGGSNTYIAESAADRLDFVVGGSTRVRFDSTTAVSIFSVPLYLGATQRLYLDGGINTYITESSSDAIQIVCGGNQSLYITSTYMSCPGTLYSSAWPTTASAANAYIANNEGIQRSTSSRRYKADIAPIPLGQAKQTVAQLQAITYRGIGAIDHKRRFPGFIAEEVAAFEPLLCTYDDEGRPDYVTYDRVAAFLVPVVQDLERRLSALEGAVA